MEYLVVRKQIEQIANTDSADIDWLFCEVLNIKRSQLSLKPEVNKAQYKQLLKYANRLKKGMPLSVALGKTEFYGLNIVVNTNVLTPRSETEELVDYVIKDISQKQHVKVLDLCCGSGAIGIAIAKNTQANVVCADISNHAIKVTKKNAKLNNVNVKVIKSNMLQKIFGNFDYIICNPPYIAVGDQNIDAKVYKWEPHLALYAPDNGYYFYNYLAQNVGIYMLSGSKLCLEVGANMAKNVADLFKNFANVEILTDMQGIERMVIITK